MKHFLVLSLVLLMCAAALCGCGGDGDSAAEENGGTARGGTLGTADANACAANRKLISSAAKQYQMLEGAYPANLRVLVPGYLQEVPDCPSGGTYTLQGGAAVCSVHGG